MGAVAGDYDGDGYVDLYVTNVGANTLYRNEAGKSLQDESARAGVAHPGWSTSGAFLDHDADGDLDLFVVNYLRWSQELEKQCFSEQGELDYCSPQSYDAPAPDVLYANQGNGTFIDITEAAGLSKSFGNGLGVVACDLDGDARMDIYVANDMMPNQLWKNGGDDTFEDIALFAGCAANLDGASEASMGTAAIDIENDGDLDLFLTHLRDETNTFYRNQSGVFTDRTNVLGLASPSRLFTGFGTGFGDFDQDGVLDLYVANGAVTRARQPHSPEDPYAEPNQLYRGSADSKGRVSFREVFPRGGLEGSPIRTSRGCALGDLDGDGDLDVLIVESQQAVTLLQNQTDSGHWLMLELIDGQRHAIGAKAKISAHEGNPSFAPLWRSVLPGTSYCSSHDPRLHFGLGEYTAKLDATVHWADGAEERFEALEVDQVHRLVRSHRRAR